MFKARLTSCRKCCPYFGMLEGTVCFVTVAAYSSRSPIIFKAKPSTDSTDTRNIWKVPSWRIIVPQTVIIAIDVAERIAVFRYFAKNNHHLAGNSIVSAVAVLLPQRALKLVYFLPIVVCYLALYFNPRSSVNVWKIEIWEVI